VSEIILKYIKQLKYLCHLIYNLFNENQYKNPTEKTVYLLKELLKCQDGSRSMGKFYSLVWNDGFESWVYWVLSLLALWKWKWVAQSCPTFCSPAGSWEKEESPEKHLFLLYWLCQSLCVDQLVKNPPVMQENPVWSLGWEEPVEEGMASYSGILAWIILMDRGAWQASPWCYKESNMTEQLSTESAV